MSDKRIAWLTVAVALLLVAYVYNTASVGNSEAFINKYIWKPMHESNQYVSLAFLLLAIVIAICQLKAIFKIENEKPKDPPLW